jgi:osmotically-inducible protein OsmY
LGRRVERCLATRKTEKGARKVSDDNLRKDVKDELHWDPKLDDAEIAVSAENGVITLRGTVGSLREKRDAKRAAERVYGVMRVENKLEVRLMGDSARKDAELRGDVLQALMLDSLVPPTIEASVDDGYVRLSGTAEWKYQRDEAEHVAGNVRGVVGVWDDVELLGAEPDGEEVHHAIAKAIERNAKLDVRAITVESEGRTVTLKGTVSSWAEHDDAVQAAWSAPGVQKVKDHLLVAY